MKRLREPVRRLFLLFNHEILEIHEKGITLVLSACPELVEEKRGVSTA
ncbi:MAG: hypothetical protein PWQ55_2786 [Chloroflexota bacterium]|nr:hypothetical protein [Chloroflexota bacterium]